MEQNIHHIYRVEFMYYTNALKEYVHDKKNNEYLFTGQDFLIRDTEFDKYQRYGGGFRKLEYVGTMFD